MRLDTSRDVTSRACLGDAVGAAGTQVGLLELLTAAVLVLTGRGYGKTMHWACEKRLRATPPQNSAEMAVFAPLTSASPGGFSRNPANPIY